MATSSLSYSGISAVSKLAGRQAARAEQPRAVRSRLVLPSYLQRDAVRPTFRCHASGGEQEPKSSEMDFDAYLALFAEKFEASENKGAVAGYSVGAVIALIFIEYFIHLPVFNILLGFPLQLLGIAMAPYLGVRYLMDGKDVKEDIGDAFNAVTEKLPGLK
mmetsp:Transcript_9959/g.16733  ORF Transcript_9959/g.16733 Transcript_9959/m.16733 type:complete len:161 (-) Transcript_9959:231-713(-)|eukprot:CAMPEP_0168609158 /NCGR_PEP_ID=MMETSP0449_2-20121227/1047_1 /TAXON_ID=1082188 /ORGANISM="Strombidium rassoulzadegani, Strain ras09" /LENGTH=160 /DNA_ID=CAMNT_0008649263 /DNA_START=43 /DNA_END=525 /DNA_ORIENTATION=-